MPVVSTGYAGAVSVCRLVTANTVECRHAFAFRPANYIGEMAMAIITLLRIIRGCMTIYATRRSQDRVDLLPFRQAVGPSFSPLEIIATECAPRQDYACHKEEQ